MKIVGNTVGMGLPKPDLRQTDPRKGDFVKGKEEFLEQISGGNVDQGGGLSATAKALLIAILRNGVFVSDQSESITALESALASSGGNDDSGGSGDSGEPQTITFAQTGSVLAIGGIDNITTTTQTGSVLALA